MSILNNQTPQKYLKSKGAVNFIQKHCRVSKKTAKTVVDQIRLNIDDPSFVLGVNAPNVRAFWNRPTKSLAVGIEDIRGGMWVVFDV